MTAPATPRQRAFFWLPVVLVVATLIGEGVGIQRFDVLGARITLLPLIFAFIAGLLLNPCVCPLGRWLLDDVHVEKAASYLAVATMPLIAYLSAYIGPQFSEVAEVGLALVLQELGNLGTMFFALPLAVLGFGMGREAIGATFSIGREGGLAFIFGRYGGGSPEGTGVMGVYICGTFFGAAFFGVFPPVIAALDWFDVRALAMACGTGSASMTGTCASSLASVYPDDAERIAALAASSNLMSGLTSLFIIIFITLPLTEWLYARLARR